MPDLTHAAAYHERTKHHFQRYARSLGYLDWATQPDPFRRFEGSLLFRLPLTTVVSPALYDQLFQPDTIPSCEPTLAALSELFQYSLAITAWKSFGGNTWALRANPSSGNLHPTEAYLLAGGVAGLEPGPALYHYAPREHGLELRARVSSEAWRELTAGFPPGTLFVGLTSIFWREAWKYGERAFRYCQHDVGHALAGLRLAAATLGWRMRLLDGLGDERLGRLLGLDRGADFPVPQEREKPELLVAIMPDGSSLGNEFPTTLAEAAVACVANGEWLGRANRLSSEHVAWPVIDEVSRACLKPETEPFRLPDESPARGPARPPRSPAAATLFQQRRSAVSCDARTSLARDDFFGLLDRLLPRRDTPPWDAWPWPPCVHLGLFVHRVDGLPAGQYVLVRRRESLADLRQAMSTRFLWRTPPACPPHLPLFCLLEGDVREAATQVSCGQEIAGDGAFSLGMLADWRTAGEFGEWFYPRLFWEAGLIGQMLYLEAEALGVRGTGIGCYFDDPVHERFGLRGSRFQSMYHFTIGGPLDDQRLTTLPPYPA